MIETLSHIGIIGALVYLIIQASHTSFMMYKIERGFVELNRELTRFLDKIK